MSSLPAVSDPELEFTGERYLPSIGGQIKYEHVHRYALCLREVAGRDVLDIACGEGYGSALLAQSARRVVGVDIDAEAVGHARRTYAGRANLAFETGSADAIPLQPGSVDVVVSFETIEHHDRHEEMLAEIKRVLRPGGRLIISSPDKRTYSDEPGNVNEYHVKELYLEEFRDLLERHFRHVVLYGQRLGTASFVGPLQPRAGSAGYEGWTAGADGAPVAGPAVLPDPVYLVAACSDLPIEPLPPSLYLEPAIDLYAEHLVVARWAQGIDAERIAATDARDQAQRERDEAVARSEALAAEKNAIEAQRDAVLAQRAALQAERDALIGERDALADERNALSAERAALTERLAATAAELQQTAAARDALAEQAGAAQAQVQVVSAEAARLRGELEQQRGLAREASAALQAIRTSTSWRLTAPARAVRYLAPGATPDQRAKLRSGTWGVLRKMYHGLPVAPNRRMAVQGAFYRAAPGFFEGMPSYELWKSRQAAMRTVVPPPVISAAAVLQDDEAGLPVLACPEQPLASVVIPVYGKLDYTLACLRSLAVLRARVPFEVIVVDDCSPDDSVETLARVQGLRLVRNAVNLGFVRSCNAGAAAARGEYVVMLNNDTEVQPDWLDALIDTFASEPRAGLVGSKLLYPDGRLQEAGGILWNDATGWNYGRLDDPSKPEYCYQRDVDYISGASIALRRSLWNELGGFDERYAPAYFEDADLAFAVRQAGFRVVYQPASRVVHHEGISSGTDLGSGVKAYQVVNRSKFAEKWAGRLATHRAPGESPRLERDRDVIGRMLVIDATTPTPDLDAGSVTAYFFLKLFRELGYKVVFAPENLAFIDKYTPALQTLGIECLYVPHVGTIRDYLREHGGEFDVVILYRAYTANNHLQDVKRYCPQARIVFDTVDLHYLREERQAALTGSAELMEQSARTKQVEFGVMRSVDTTIVLSEVEVELLQREDPSLNLFIVPLLLELYGRRRQFAERRDIVFIGSFQHTPNADAVEYFVQSIWPIVSRQLPDARFLIIGSRMPESIAAMSSIERVVPVGFVADLAEYFDSCRLTVVPLRFGAGIKGKIGTSASYGVPAVATSIAVEGMGLVDGEQVLVADTPEEFARQVVRLYRDEALWRRISDNSVAFVDDRYSLRAGKQRLANLLQSVGREVRNDLETGVCRSLGDYLGRHAAMRPVFAARQEHERRLVGEGGRPFRIQGHCRVCDGPRSFEVDYLAAYLRDERGVLLPNWRETLVCSGCGLNNRVRAAADIFTNVLAAGAGSRVYATEQLTPFFQWLTARFPNAIGSEYLGDDVVGGTIKGGLRHEDMTRLSFADDSLDFILSFDVLEHVPDYRKALSECMRVLRPGGTMLMSVPFVANAQQTLVRAVHEADGTLRHLMEPEFHGNPTRPADGSLCYYHFGWDLLDDARARGAQDARLMACYSRPYGYLGDEQMLFLLTKG